MSLHFEWSLSLRLRPDAPEEFLDELRYHLGLTGIAPKAPTLDREVPALAAGQDRGALAGGAVTSLVRQQPYLNRPAVWGVFTRVFVIDDVMYDLVQVVPPWLARWSLTQGWIGFAREEMSLDTWLNFFAAEGYAYAASPGGIPEPLNTGAPPFTPTQTTDAWP